MKTKSLFLLILFFSLYQFVYSSDYAVYKQKDELKEWLNKSFDKILLLDEASQFESAENLCDSVFNNIWRDPELKEEYDALFNISLYKAIYLQDKGNISQASSYFEIALKQYNKSSQNNSSNLSFIYPKLGNNYTRLGDNENAILVHKKMVKFAKSENDYEAIVQALVNLSIAYDNRGEVDKALEVLDKTEEYFKEISFYSMATVFSNRGNFLFDINPLDYNAEMFLKKAEGFFEMEKADPYFIGGINKTLGLIYKEKKDLKTAKKHFVKSVEYYKKSTQFRKRDIAKVYIEYVKIIEKKEKKEYLEIALVYLTNRIGFDNLKFSDLYAENTFIEILTEAIHLESNDDIKLKYLEYIFEVQKLLRQEYIFDDSKLELLNENNKFIEDALEICLKKYDETQNEKYVFKAFENVENSKSILLFEALFSESSMNTKANYQDFIIKKKQIVSLLVESKQKGNQSEVTRLEKLLNDLVFDFEINNSDFKNAIPSNDLKWFSALDFKDDFLKENECLLSYFIGENKVFVITLSKSESNLTSIQNDEKFKSDIQDFTLLFQFENRFQFNQNLASRLGDKLLKITDVNIDKLIILTDGFLNNIPFEALIKKDKFLIEDYKIQYAFSAKILQNIKSEKVNNKKLIAFAPIFENEEQKYLRNSEKEVTDILDKINGEAFLKEHASSKSFLNLAKEYSIIHISTHSKVEEKMNSASIDFFDKTLFFSQIKDEKFNADLMVLSACETGIGNQKIGEGSMSISRAFAYSNIDAFVSSLWKVNEESSVLIFDNFYKNINNGQSISSSLRNSKLNYINNKNISEMKKSPYYWAPYVFIGNDKLLNVHSGSSYMNYLIFFGFLLAIAFFIWKFKK